MVGFFDSGSGGLSVLTHFRNLAPKVDVVYFGDIKNAPYGERSADELAALTVSGVSVLKAHGAGAIVSACNSVSPSILSGAAEELPFVEMTKPTARYMEQYRGKKFLLLATPATVASGIYQRALEGIVALEPLGVPGLAGAIEFNEGEAHIQKILEGALASQAGKRYDGAILACTHYPLALPLLASILMRQLGSMLIIDPGLPVAAEAAETFGSEGGGSLTFLISKENQAFRERVTELFPAGSFTIELV